MFIFSAQVENKAALIPEIEDLLNSYEDVFKDPSRLPLTRNVNYKINLKEGANPVSLRPYRYLATQKYIIERMINEKL